MSFAIETYNLSKKFPVIKGYRDLLLHPFRKTEITALNEVNVRIKRGELFGLLGPNGAGKTTLIKILCTLVLPTSGKAFINGLEVTEDGKKIRKTMGYVISDERSFYWRLTGRQNLRFFAKLNNISNREADQKIERLLETLEITHDADRMFKDYSTGMRQRLSIARALFTDPEIIFMDEPTNGLDPPTAQNLRRLVRKKLVDEDKRTVLFATHNLQEAEELCDRIAIIHEGKIKIEGAVEEIKGEFRSDKRYVIKVKGLEDSLLERIDPIARVEKVIPISNGSFSKTLQMEIVGLDGSISRLIKEIEGLGGEVVSFYQKEPSLVELFSKVVEKEK